MLYSGEHGSPESLDEYRRLVLEWLRVNQMAPQQRTLTVDELVLRYLEHAARPKSVSARESALRFKSTDQCVQAA